MAKEYKAVELVLEKVERGVIKSSFHNKGYRNAAETPWMERHVVSTETRECLANYVPELKSSVFVSVPHKDVHGESIPSNVYAQLLAEAQADGVLVATQSGEKNGNYVRISTGAFETLSQGWGDKGPKFLQAVGLLFSTMTAGTYQTVVVRVITEGHPFDRGQDGNGMAPKGALPCSMQIRGMAKGNPQKVAKGIVSPVSPDGHWYIHHSQLKGLWGDLEYNGEELEVEIELLLNKGVSSEEVLDGGKLRQRKSWLSSEVTALVRDTRENRRWASLRARDEVVKVYNLMHPERRVELAERLGALRLDKHGNLEPSWNAGAEALRTPIPWCIELEELLGRFVVPEVVKITHGAGIGTFLSLIVQDEKYGKKPISREEALGRTEIGKKVYALYRVPTTGAQAVLFFRSNPYKKGVGFVVSPDAAKLMDGDSDGDIAFIVYDQDAVKFLLNGLDASLSGTGKPSKQAKPGWDITPINVLSYWAGLVQDHSLVGRSTVMGWRLIRDGQASEAVSALTAANAAPMTAKHRVRINGEVLAEMINRLSREEKLRLRVQYNEAIENNTPTRIGYDAQNDVIRPASLLWRDYKDWSATVRTPRGMAEWKMGDPESVLDACVKSVTESIQKWVAAHPYSEVGVADIARIEFGKTGRTIPGWAVRKAALMRAEWGNFWKSHMHTNSEGERVFDENINANSIYKKVRTWGASVEVEALAALLTLKRHSSESMSLKWAAVFDTHRGVEVLGFDEDIKAALDAKKARLGHVAPVATPELA